VVTFPEAYAVVLSMILGIGGLLAVTYGGAIAGSEWQWGTLKAAVARGESRTRYMLLTYLAVAVYAVLGLLAAFAIGVAAAAIGASMLDVSLDGLGDPDALARLPEQFGRAALAVSMNTALGVRDRDRCAEPAGRHRGRHRRLLRRGDREHLPAQHQSAGSRSRPRTGRGPGRRRVVRGGGEAVAGAALDPNVAVVVVAAWLFASLAVSALVTERAEIGG